VEDKEKTRILWKISLSSAIISIDYLFDALESYPDSVGQIVFW